MTRIVELERSFPTFFQVIRPIRRALMNVRRLVQAALVLVAILLAGVLWWWIQLWGLPDIGAPFDVEAMRSESIPDDRNAFVLYRQAIALYKPFASSQMSPSSLDVNMHWSRVSPEMRQWAEANRDASVVFRRGAERPDALDIEGRGFGEYDRFNALGPFQRLALLEASRLEEKGDMTGAWGWYRAYLRTLHLVGARAAPYRRSIAQHWCKQLLERLESWSSDVRTSPADLRRALDDVIACEAIVPSEAYSLKALYVQLEPNLGSRQLLGGMPPTWLSRLAGTRVLWLIAAVVPPEQISALSAAWTSWRSEPERSRRVLSLLIANRLAFYGMPRDRRPSPDPDVAYCDIYPLGPEAPAQARALTTAALGRWLESTSDPAGLAGFLDSQRVRIMETANHHALVMLLANRLYRRDHGNDPPTPEVLVGPYLKRLPSEYPDDGRTDTPPGDAESVD